MFCGNSCIKRNQASSTYTCHVCGLVDPPLFNKNKYFLLFINDFSRKIWVYFLIQKSEAFVAFNNFKALVENKSDFEIRALRPLRPD